MMKRISSVVLCVVFFNYCIPLCAESLDVALWKQVDSCYSQLKDDEDELQPDAVIIDDIKNGYLSVSGSYPACGCACENSVAAYKKASGDYLYLGTEAWDCSFSHRVYSSESLEQVLPNGFGFNSFTDRKIENIPDGMFYISTTIPRKGTDTKISISAIPFGMGKACDNGLCSSFSGDDWSKLTDMTELRKLIGGVVDSGIIYKLLGEKFSELTTEEIGVLERIFGEERCGEESCPVAKKLHGYLKTVYRTYLMYEKITYTDIVLGWDKREGKFFVKSKVNAGKPLSFYEFIKAGKFWQPLC